MDLLPTENRVIVRVIPPPDRTAHGLVLPDVARDRPDRGLVLAVGPGRVDGNGGTIPMQVEVGDEVVFSQYGGTELTVDGESVLLLQESDLLAKIT